MVAGEGMQKAWHSVSSWWSPTLPRRWPWSFNCKRSKNKVPSSKDGSHYAKDTNKSIRIQSRFWARLCVLNYL